MSVMGTWKRRGPRDRCIRYPRLGAVQDEAAIYLFRYCLHTCGIRSVIRFGQPLEEKVSQMQGAALDILTKQPTISPFAGIYVSDVCVTYEAD